MKRILLLTILSIGLSTFAKAQVEVKINPIALLFENVSVDVEFGLSNNWGLNISPIVAFNKFDVGEDEFRRTQFGAVVNPRYYFSPTKGINKFYLGAYGKFQTGKIALVSNTDDNVKNTRLAVGINIGYKIVTNGNFVFDIGFGLGRAFINEYSNETGGVDLSEFPLFNIDATGIFAIGYRF